MTAHVPFPMIVGVARSGTTLLRLMLDAHPDLAIPAETGFLLPLFERRSRRRLRSEEFVELVTGFHTWQDLATPAERFARDVSQIKPFRTADAVRQFYASYAHARGKTRGGDKTPIYGLHMRAVEELLPEAHFIHIIRDGRDVALSVEPTWFRPADTMEGLAAAWSAEVGAIRAAGAHARHYLEIRYEDLIHDAVDVLRRICDFVALPYAPSMLRYHATAYDRLSEEKPAVVEHGVVVESSRRLELHRLTNQPPQASRAGRWRSEMPVEVQAAFAAHAGTRLRELGYPT